jgi:signal transduction histidine kinase
MFKKIYLLEDDPAHALLIKRALKGEEVEVVHVTTVEDAKKLLTNEGSLDSVLISDLQLPDSDGISHIGTLSALAPNIPVIVLTSSTALSDAVGALRNGAKDFLVKDFNQDFSNLLKLALARQYALSELDRERRELLRDLNLLKVAIESSADGLAVLTHSCEVRYSNQGFISFINIVGLDPKDLLVDKKPHDGGVVSFEFSSGERSFEVSVTGVSNALVVWVRDRTDQKRRERFQRELLSTTTHDLKGPLGAIRVSAEMLQGILPKDEKPYQLVIRMASAVQNCINLIDEFLSARRIQEGSLRLKPTKTKVSNIVTSVIDEFMPIATSRKIELRSEGVAGEISCDEMGIRRVLGNLLSNALKFTPSGGRVVVRSRNVQGGVELEVEDSGHGMEPSEVQGLFERFSRLERHSEIEGSGLGLFVVRSIVQAHGGTIQVASRVNSGSRFTVTLPVLPTVNARGELECIDFG